jgi:hypothetical protein
MIMDTPVVVKFVIVNIKGERRFSSLAQFCCCRK